METCMISSASSNNNIITSSCTASSVGNNCTTSTYTISAESILNSIPSLSNGTISIDYPDYPNCTTGLYTTKSETVTVESVLMKKKDSHPEWNVKKEILNEWTVISGTPSIVNIKMIVPDKVVEVTIFDGTPYTFKQVCKEPDVFDLKYALALAWSKYENAVYKRHLTMEGIEYYANQFMFYDARIIKELNRAIKAYNKWVKEEDKKKAEEEERKAIIARRKEKNRKRREKRKTKQNEEQINIIAKAIQMSKEG